MPFNSWPLSSIRKLLRAINADLQKLTALTFTEFMANCKNLLGLIPANGNRLLSLAIARISPNFSIAHKSLVDSNSSEYAIVGLHGREFFWQNRHGPFAGADESRSPDSQ